MAKGQPSQHAEILQYALSHLEAERDKIQVKIDAIRQEMGSGRAKPGRKSAASAVVESIVPAVPARKKRELSEGARKRIAAAQKKRWAEHRKKQKAG